MSPRSLQITSLGLACLTSFMGNHPGYVVKLQAATDLSGLAQVIILLGEENGYHFIQKDVPAAMTDQAALVQDQVTFFDK